MIIITEQDNYTSSIFNVNNCDKSNKSFQNQNGYKQNE